ncbi:MAG: ECF transporter S component [Thermoplasmata archaeon]
MEDGEREVSDEGPKIIGGGDAKFVSPKTVAIYGVLTALTAAITIMTVIPFPPTRGYFNLGEAMVFFSAFTFGWRAGAICGGVGSAVADVLAGFGMFAPTTLVAKGAEGLVAGAIGRLNGGKPWAYALGIAAGGACMITVYFLSEWLLLDFGLGAALAEIPTNIAQVTIGGTVGTLLSYAVKRSMPSLGK